MPPDAKATARPMVADGPGRARRVGAHQRAAAPRSREADLEAVARLAAGMRIPKVESAEDVQWVADRCARVPADLRDRERARRARRGRDRDRRGVRHLSMGGVDLRRDLNAGDGDLHDALRALAPCTGLARRRARRRRSTASTRTSTTRPGCASRRVRACARLLRQVRDPSAPAARAPRRLHPVRGGGRLGPPGGRRLRRGRRRGARCRAASSSTSRSPSAHGVLELAAAPV